MEDRLIACRTSCHISRKLHRQFLCSMLDFCFASFPILPRPPRSLAPLPLCARTCFIYSGHLCALGVIRRSWCGPRRRRWPSSRTYSPRWTIRAALARNSSKAPAPRRGLSSAPSAVSETHALLRCVLRRRLGRHHKSFNFYSFFFACFFLRFLLPAERDRILAFQCHKRALELGPGRSIVAVVGALHAQVTAGDKS